MEEILGSGQADLASVTDSSSTTDGTIQNSQRAQSERATESLTSGHEGLASDVEGDTTEQTIPNSRRAQSEQVAESPGSVASCSICKRRTGFAPSQIERFCSECDGDAEEDTTPPPPPPIKRKGGLVPRKLSMREKEDVSRILFSLEVSR